MQKENREKQKLIFLFYFFHFNTAIFFNSHTFITVSLFTIKE